jgi:DNA-binding transcriptional MerR regulator
VRLRAAQAAVAKVQEFLQELSEREELRIKESAEVLEKERADMRSSIDELKQQIKQCEQEKTEVRTLDSVLLPFTASPPGSFCTSRR